VHVEDFDEIAKKIEAVGVRSRCLSLHFLVWHGKDTLLIPKAIHSVLINPTKALNKTDTNTK